MPASSPVGRDRVDRFAANYDALRYALSRLSEQPYLNSIPPTLKAMDVAGSALVAEYLHLLNRAGAAISGKDNRISTLESSLSSSKVRLDTASSALTEYVRNNGIAGIVVEASDQNKVYVFIDPRFLADGGKERTAWIFRGEDEQIAELRLALQEDLVTGTVVSRSEGKTIMDSSEKRVKTAIL